MDQARKGIEQWHTSRLRTPRGALFAVFLSAMLAGLYFPGSLWGWNQNSRLGLVMAIVDQASLTIDDFHERAGTETGDKSVHDGHVYSDKAIGTAILGVPAYWLSRPLLERALTDPPRHAGLARMVVTGFAISLPFAIAITMLFGFAWRSSASPATATLAATAGMLGTPAWPFATVLFGHTLAAALLLMAFILTRQLRDGARHPIMVCIGVGVLLGLAAVTEYPAAALCGLLGLYLAAVLARMPASTRWPGLGLAIAAGSLPLLLLGAYNAQCFGSPWTLSYAVIADPMFSQVHDTGLLGVSMPRADRLLYLTLHPVRGLFAQSPILLAGAAGLIAMARTPGWRLEAAVLTAAVATLLVINAGFPIWWGGRSFAARHLVPCTVLLCAPIAFLSPRWRPVLLMLLGLSIVQMAIATATTPIPNDDALTAMLGDPAPLGWTGTSPIWNDA